MTHALQWVNGVVVDTQAPIAFANDHGLQLGDGVFDTIAVRNSHPAFLSRHLRRLRAGIDRLEIRPTPTDEELAAAIGQLIEANKLTEARIRVTITPGPGHSPRKRGAHPLTVISSSPLTNAQSTVSLCTVPWVRNERSPLAGIKSTSWGENAAIVRYARDAGFDNALLCDSSDRLSECPTSNLYLVIDNITLTPTLQTGCLPGIIREVLIENSVVAEGDLSPADIAKASEVFITSSTAGVVAVTRIDDTPFSAGPKTKAAQDLIKALSQTD
ncbi:MAG: aminotransferase class IV [Acidimicrobiales bacterium]